MCSVMFHLLHYNKQVPKRKYQENHDNTPSIEEKALF